MKQNAFKWVCDTVKAATTAVVLTHNVDFLFIQSIVIPRLRKVGHPRLTVFADAGCATGSYSQQRPLLEGLGTRYRVVPVDLGPGRRFHPKAILLAGPDKAALAVGSGNLTHGGWSANREIWANFVSDEDAGRSALAAFSRYLENVLAMVPMRETLADHVMSAFDPRENSWVTELPEPGGLLSSPAESPLLDRIAALAGDGVESVTVCAPYFDPKGEALAEIGRRFPAPVTTLLQPGRAGLAKPAAASLPANVSLASVDSLDDEDSSRFIHAKLFAFRREGSTLLVAGSANCSRAALMADTSWGNAELVAVSEVAHEVADELLADLQVSATPPALPDGPPSDDWANDSPKFRILAARRLGRVIEIAYKSAEAFDALWLEADGLDRIPATDQALSGNTAKFLIADRPEWIRLIGSLQGGNELVSERMWVDDEAALGIAAPERRIRAKLSESGGKTKWSTSDYVEILELFDQHLRQPVKPARATRGQDEQNTAEPACYRIEDVFSESFGRPPPRQSAGGPQGFGDEDFFRLFLSFFTGDPETPEHPRQKPADTQIEEDRNPEEEEQKLLKRKQRVEDEERARTERERLRPKLLRALKRVEQAMSDPSFVAGRPPERLGADIGSTALLLRKALSDRVLLLEEFRSTTRSLWEALFFGRDGAPGAISAQLATGTAGDTFADRMASPRLSAALALWCLLEWENANAEAAWFRLSAARLAAKLPWLVGGGTPEEVADELSRIAGALLSGENQDALLLAWRHWVRAGAALAALEDAVKGHNQKDLGALISRESVSEGELLWQGGEFCTAVRACRRDSQSKCEVLPLGRSASKRFLGNWLAPVSDLLASDRLALTQPVRQEIAGLLDGLRLST